MASGVEGVSHFHFTHLQEEW